MASNEVRQKKITSYQNYKQLSTRFSLSWPKTGQTIYKYYKELPDRPPIVRPEWVRFVPSSVPDHIVASGVVTVETAGLKTDITNKNLFKAYVLRCWGRSCLAEQIRLNYNNLEGISVITDLNQGKFDMLLPENPTPEAIATVLDKLKQGSGAISTHPPSTRKQNSSEAESSTGVSEHGFRTPTQTKAKRRKSQGDMESQGSQSGRRAKTPISHRDLANVTETLNSRLLNTVLKPPVNRKYSIIIHDIRNSQKAWSAESFSRIISNIDEANTGIKSQSFQFIFLLYQSFIRRIYSCTHHFHR